MMAFSMLKMLLLPYLLAFCAIPAVTAFSPHSIGKRSTWTSGGADHKHLLYLADDFLQETNMATQERIRVLVDSHPVVLFMKGSKLFPQCGFSNTAVQILQSFGVEYHTVDVLADDKIRAGVKDFSQWPTIPQLYVCGEFIGGSDIMIELYQSGELGEMIEKAKAEMM